MTVKTSTSFDLDTLRRGYEDGTSTHCSALYADEVELIQIDRDNPPSAPRIATAGDLQGHARALRRRRVRRRWRMRVADEDRAAATVTCEFPGGRKVVANAIFELQRRPHRP